MWMLQDNASVVCAESVVGLLLTLTRCLCENNRWLSQPWPASSVCHAASCSIPGKLTHSHGSSRNQKRSARFCVHLRTCMMTEWQFKLSGSSYSSHFLPSKHKSITWKTVNQRAHSITPVRHQRLSQILFYYLVTMWSPLSDKSIRCLYCSFLMLRVVRVLNHHFRKQPLHTSSFPRLHPHLFSESFAALTASISNTRASWSASPLLYNPSSHKNQSNKGAQGQKQSLVNSWASRKMWWSRV